MGLLFLEVVIPDQAYRTFPSIFASKGVTARYAPDSPPAGTYLNLDNAEEQTENAICNRLGSIIINRSSAVIDALPDPVHSLSKLLGLDGNAWRYAGAGTTLYRRTGTTQGPYSAIATGMSGEPWQAGVYRPTQSSYPYLFVADAARMLKDNGSVTQQWGIFQPEYPVTVQIEPPQLIDLSSVVDDPAANIYVNLAGSATTSFNVNTTYAGAIGGQVNTINPASMTGIQVGQVLETTGEAISVLAVQTTTFTAFFQFNHAPGDTLTAGALNVSVAASTTATITYPVSPFTMPNLGIFPNNTKTQPEDYISLAILLDQPNDIQQINLLFDCGDGTFTQDYFVKTFQPALDQALISGTETAEQAAVNQVFATAVGLTTPTSYNPSYLSTGDGTYTYTQTKLVNFATVGNADASSANFGWANVNSLQIQIVTNTNGGVNLSFSNFFLAGGYGPDSTGGVGYDYLFTYYNNVTGAESNPCIPMSSVIPTTSTTYYPARYPLPIRQPILLSLVPSSDPQVTNIRIYRRGGTLADNYLRLDQVPANTTSYLDILADADIESSDIVSFVNDVPVTSTLPVPVNTTLTVDIPATGNGAVFTITPVSMANISVHQQVTLGGISDPNEEIVIVISVTGSNFTAFVQNPHDAGDPVTAEAIYGQPCNIMAIAYNAAWLAGDPNNPHYLYYSTNFSPESFGSPNFIEVGIPSDPITAIVPFQGSLFVATRDHWYGIAPASGAAPTVYPTSAVHGCFAMGGWVATESEIWHVAIDGLRTFNGSTSTYRSQEIEFLFQGGATPIPLVNMSQLQTCVMSYRDNMVFCAYPGQDGNIHRLIYHVVYQRYRNDDVSATSMFWESDNNLLIYGDQNGLIHQDRIGNYDEEASGGFLVRQPIAMNMQTAFMDYGLPKNNKQFNEATIDCNTNGQELDLTLLFNDGEIVIPLGTFSSTSREKINLNINDGAGQQAYRVALQITGDVTQQVTLFQADIRGIELAETRKSYDSYVLRFGTDESKIAKDVYVEYSATEPVVFNVYYDNSSVAGFTFTLAPATRISTRIRMPAVKFRLFRFVATSTADFQLWLDSHVLVKPVIATRGYQSQALLP